MKKEEMEKLKSLRMLLVEDDDVLRDELSSLFNKLFEETVTASNGEEGLKKFTESGKIDIILSDINMPVMNGLEMVRRIKQADEDIPVIFLTAYSDNNYLLEALQLHVSDYLIKPFKIPDLLKKLEKAYLPVYQKKLLESQNEQLEALNKKIEADAKREINKLKKDILHTNELNDLFNNYTITDETDLNGKITYASRPFLNISGFTEEELIGSSHKILRHEDMPNELYKNLWETIKNNKVWSGQIKNKSKDGSDYWVESVIFPLVDEQDNIIGYKSIRVDITAQKATEELVNSLIEHDSLELNFE